ncbi:hypothetical protein [Bradyrhizobium genosp. P]|uniref:hypothetical protein n=1 Tax=Bradyrhizobium genosp. P TaxID=83641 RepID=UPI003CEAAEA1
MEEKDHINGVGNIVLNLQALETLLRGFLVEKSTSSVPPFQIWATKSRVGTI